MSLSDVLIDERAPWPVHPRLQLVSRATGYIGVPFGEEHWVWRWTACNGDMVTDDDLKWLLCETARDFSCPVHGVSSNDGSRAS